MFAKLFAVLLLALGLAGQTAKATLGVEESFNYATGNLAGNSITVFSATRTWLLVGTAPGPQVVAGNLTYNGLNTPATPGAMAQWTRETDLATGNQTMFEVTHPGLPSTYSFAVQPPATGQIFYRVGSP